MAVLRRFLNNSMDELETIFHSANGDTALLTELKAELKHRKSKKAATLFTIVEKHLGNAAPTKKTSPRIPEDSNIGQPPVPSKGIQPEEPATLPRTPPPAIADHGSRRNQDDGNGNTLPLHLIEFVVALKQEVEAAKRNLGGSAALLSDGRLIAPVGGVFHYRFQSQRPLRVPPDTPGFLALAGYHDDIPVSVVEIEDLAVVLELPQHIGVLLSQAKLKTDLTMLLLKLIDRIETKGVNHHLAADRILGFAPATTSALSFDAFNPRLNAEQRLAVGSVLGGDTVFIWGPPGTGKTQAIGEIGAQLFRKGATLLIVSHTNTAVDEALLRIAQALEGQFDEGSVLRLGEPVKTELQNRPDLILKCVAEKRSDELKRQKRAAEETKASTSCLLESVNRCVEIRQWITETDEDCDSFFDRHQSIVSDEQRTHAMADELIQLANEKIYWEKERDSAKEHISKEQALVGLEMDLSTWRDRLETVRQNRELNTLALRKTEELWPKAKQAEPHRSRLKNLPLLEAARSASEFSKTMSDQARNLHQAKAAQLKEAQVVLQQSLSVGAIKRMWLKLPKPEDQQAVVTHLTRKVELGLANLTEAEKETARCDAVLTDVVELTELVNSLSEVPELPEVETNLRAHIDCSHQLDAEENFCQERYDLQYQQHVTLSGQIHGYVKDAGLSAKDVYSSAVEKLEAIESLEREMISLQRKVTAERRKLAADLEELVRVLASWDLCKINGSSVEALITALQAARLAAHNEVGDSDMNTLVTERDRLSALVAQLLEEIRSIEDALKKVEADLLANVRILATTLTRSFMRDGIQQRGFDTVLVDEASMAPIPALWAAATLAERCIVTVGDFKQLPPIVQSEEPIAGRWLGRDIFAASGVQGAWQRGASPPHFVALKEQHRMHPDVSAIVNALVYKGILRDGDTVKGSEADNEIETWHAGFVKNSDRVNIIDMAKANAWNTTSDRSRFNLLSAMVSMELIHHWLAPERPQLAIGQPKRILVICPYRPQAKLLDIMVREDRLDIEVSANTAHSFQGSEADAVLIDLVVDQPHHKANLLASIASENISRLLNVAITRAKRKVCILADMSWFHIKGRAAFVGGSLLPWLSKRHPIQCALDVLPGIKSGNEHHTVLSPSDTSSLLLKAINGASRHVIIFSPILDVETVKEITQGASMKRFYGFVVTQEAEEQGANARDHAEAESLLLSAGYRIIHKSKMVDKAAIIDGEDVWSSSFALLGPIPVHGFCVRRCSRKFATEVNDFCFIDKLIEPYLEGKHLCPICSKEMIAADSPKEKPFYWRCIEKGCYTRDIDTPAPLDGLVTFRCGSLPEFGYWGEIASWLCTCGQKPSHRTKIHKNHLRLPKMKALVPSRSWNKVCRELGVDPD